MGEIPRTGTQDRMRLGKVMRVLVCGGRDYQDRDRVFAVLDAIHAERPITAVIHGCAQGADLLGVAWVYHAFRTSERFNCALVPFPADWKTHGKKAGPLRNQAMLDIGKPDVVVAFPGGRGTADMVRRALRKGVEVMEVQK